MDLFWWIRNSQLITLPTQLWTLLTINLAFLFVLFTAFFLAAFVGHRCKASIVDLRIV